MEECIYARKIDGEIIQTAVLRLLGTGRYAFETSLFGQKYVLNMNMPLFDTEQDARQWIEGLNDWNLL